MKIIGGFLGLAAADMKIISCNAGSGGAAAMSMSIDKADIQRDLKDAGWTLEDADSDGTGDQWQKTVTPTPTSVTESGTGDSRMLDFEYKVEAGCKTENVDGKDICVETGHALTFKCSYPMKDQDLTEQAFTVSGSDTEDAVSKQGTLGYNIGFSNKPADDKPYEIGSAVKATITPVTSGLVHATIESCSVKNKGNSESVSLVSDGMKRECLLGVDVTQPQGTGVLTLQWESFKWNTEHAVGKDKADDEDQELTCKISLSKNAPTTESQQPADCNGPDKHGAKSVVADQRCQTMNSDGSLRQFINSESGVDGADCVKKCKAKTGCVWVGFKHATCFFYNSCENPMPDAGAFRYEV